MLVSLLFLKFLLKCWTKTLLPFPLQDMAPRQSNSILHPFYAADAVSIGVAMPR